MSSGRNEQVSRVCRVVIQRRMVKADYRVVGVEVAAWNVERAVDFCTNAAVALRYVDHLLMIARQVWGTFARDGRAFGAVYLNLAQARIGQVVRQLVGKVDVRGGEADDVTAELRARMQSVQKWLDCLGEAPVAADVHRCCVSADGGGDRRA